MLQLQPGIEWDEDDLLIRSDKIPKVPITKETELLNRQTKVSTLPTYMAQQTTNGSGRSSLD